MAKRASIDQHLNNLENQNKSKGGILILGGLVVAAAVAFMALTKSGDTETSMTSPNDEIRIEADEMPRAKLASSEKAELLDLGVVAVITPSKEQMAALEDTDEGKKIIKRNKKRTQKSTPKEIELTHDEIMMLEEAEILGANGKVFKESEVKMVQKESTLPVPFNNPLGISNGSYSAEEVKHLNMATTGYVQKVYRGKTPADIFK